jgi:hypothetical protein
MTSSFETTLMVAIMSPTVNQAQLLSAFISTLSTNTTQTLLPTLRYTALFLNCVANHATQFPTLSWAVRAVSLSHLGRLVCDQNLIQLSRQMYRQALLTLNAALQDPIDGLSSSTLAATILLSYYEVINCTERDSWIRHAGGAGHLMRLRGPSRHLIGLGRAAFLAYRHSLVTEAFLSRRATFLAVQPWQELNRAVQKSLAPADRSPISDLVAEFHLLIVEIPGFVQSASDPNTSTTTKRGLLTAGLVHHGNLLSWREELTATLEETNQQLTAHLTNPSDSTFPQSYELPSLSVGSLLCGYWAVLTILNRGLASLESEIAPNDTMGYQEENTANARASCMAVAGLSSSAFMGPMYLIFALRVAWQTFDGLGMEEEREWVVEKLEGLSSYLGIARKLLDDGDDEQGIEMGESTSQSQSASQSGTGSPEVSRRPSLQQQVLSREASREEAASGLGVSLQDIEIDRVSSGGSRSGNRTRKAEGKGRVW